jgi:hypothetical protein
LSRRKWWGNSSRLGAKNWNCWRSPRRSRPSCTSTRCSSASSRRRALDAVHLRPEQRRALVQRCRRYRAKADPHTSECRTGRCGSHERRGAEYTRCLCRSPLQSGDRWAFRLSHRICSTRRSSAGPASASPQEARKSALRSWRLPFENPARPVGSAFGAYRPNTGFIRSLLMGSLAFPVGRLQCRYPRCRPARLDDLGNLWLPCRAQRVTEGVAHLTLTGAQRICSPDGRNLLLCR